MRKEPHSLNISCSYELSNRKTKKKLKPSKFEGWINIQDGKTTIRLPMRSFVNLFLNKLRAILAGDNTGDYDKISTASAGPASAANQYRQGIMVGTGTTDVGLTQTDLVAIATNAAIVEYGATTFEAPTTLSSTLLHTKVSRLFTNASTAGWTIYEIGTKLKKNASTASAGAGRTLITRDMIKTGILFAGETNKLIDIDFRVNTSSETGGAVLNLMRLFYNLLLKGSTNASPFLPRSGSVTASYGGVTASVNPFVVDGAAAKYWGIVVGATSADSNFSVSPDGYKFDPVGSGGEHTDLTYGANTVSAVTQSGNTAYFTVSRDITNGTTVVKRINRIGLLTKGATADPSTLEAGQIYLLINRVGDENNVGEIELAVNQTLRVIYKFEISI